MRVKISLLILCALLSISCSDKKDDFLDPVKNVRLVSLMEKITVTWQNPKSDILDFIEISYIDPTDGDEKIKRVTDFIGNPSDGASTAYTSFDVYSDNEVEFTLVACSQKGLRSEEVKVKGLATPSEYDQFLKKLFVEGGIESIFFEWEEKEKDFILDIEYKYDGNVFHKEVDAFDKTTFSLPLDQAKLAEVTVFVKNADGRSQRTIHKEVEVFYENQLKPIDRSSWVIADVSDEEVVNEPAPHHGYAKNILDGNLASYWHSKHDGGAVPFPHWIIIDMGEERKISTFITTGRQNWHSTGHTRQALFISDDNKEWRHLATFPFNAKINDPQAYNLKDGQLASGRFVKIEFYDGLNGKPYAFISEFEAVGVK